ncbi:MAG: N-acetylneuraminate synthase family protein [Candidatus Pacearchaeota archaeon]
MKFIADISSNHCGSLTLAKELIYKAKECGADYAKFQYWEIDKFISKDRFLKLNLAHQKKWNQSVYDIYKKFEIPDWWIPELYTQCNKVGIEFLLSCYEISKIDKFDQYLDAWKVGSGDIDYYPMLEKINTKNKLIMLGAGASDKEDVLKACKILKSPTVVFICNTNYSNNDRENIKYLNLSRIEGYYIGINYKGISDHTKSDIPVVIATWTGMEYFERHFKLSDNDSPDSLFSLNPSEWKHMIDVTKQTYESIGDGVQKIEDNEKETRIIQRRSKKDWMRPDYEA